MRAHFVLAHPETNSFNARLVRSGVEVLEAAGWTATVSDLYAMGFDPCERSEHYEGRTNPHRFDVQAEQRHASENGTLPAHVVRNWGAWTSQIESKPPSGGWLGLPARFRW
jgi:NAD(P)H dehydrogenase (quinone)